MMDEFDDGDSDEDEGVVHDPFRTPAHGPPPSTPQSVRRKALAVANAYADATENGPTNTVRRELAERFVAQASDAVADPEQLEEVVEQILNDVPDSNDLEIISLQSVRDDMHQLHLHEARVAKRRRNMVKARKAKVDRAKRTVREHNQSSPSVSPTASPTMPVKRVPNAERAMVRSWERDLADVVRRAMAPMVRFVGAVAVKLRLDDMRKLLVWSNDRDQSMESRLRALVSNGARTVEEFMDLNRDLGRPLLFRYLKAAEVSILSQHKPEQQETEHIEGRAFDLNELDLPAATLQALYQVPSLGELRRSLAVLNALAVKTPQDDARIAEIKRNISLVLTINKASTGLVASETESIFAPAWCFEVMGDAVFRRLINDATLAAFYLALAKVRSIERCESFTLKELICSESVHHQFAFLVAAEWLNSGDDTAATTRNRGPRSKYLNLMIFRQQLGRQLDTCAIWFESVRARDNPLLRKFEEKKRQIMANLPPGTPATEERMKTLDMYGSMLPKRELVYYG